GITGAIQSGIFSPSDDSKHGADFLADRVENAAIGAAALAIMGGAGKGLTSVLSTPADGALTRLGITTASNVASGYSAGVVSATGNAAKQGRLPTLGEINQAGTTNALYGAGFSVATFGIGAVRGDFNTVPNRTDNPDIQPNVPRPPQHVDDVTQPLPPLHADDVTQPPPPLHADDVTQPLPPQHADDVTQPPPQSLNRGDAPQPLESSSNVPAPGSTEGGGGTAQHSRTVESEDGNARYSYDQDGTLQKVVDQNKTYVRTANGWQETDTSTGVTRTVRGADVFDPGSDAFRKELIRESHDHYGASDHDFDAEWDERGRFVSGQIADVFNSKQLTGGSFNELLQSFPEADRPIVSKMLDLSATNSTDWGLRRSMYSVDHQLEQFYSGYTSHYFVDDANSSGNITAYLVRKAANGPTLIYHSDQIAALDNIPSDRQVVMFENPANLSDAGKQLLTRALQTHDVALVDTSLFDRGPNVFDFGKGDDTAVNKLQSWLNDVKQIQAENPGLSQDDAIQRALYGNFDAAAADFRSTVQSDHQIHVVRPQTIDPERALAPRASADNVAAFLENQFRDPKLRLTAADMLNEESDVVSFGDLMTKLQNLRDSLRQSAEERGRSEDDDLYVMGVEPRRGARAASSDAFITRLYMQANDIPPERAVTLTQLQQMQAAHQLDAYTDSDGFAHPAKRVVFLDDTIYTGSNARGDLGQLRNFPDVTLGSLSTYNRFAKLFDSDPAAMSVADPETASDSDPPTADLRRDLVTLEVALSRYGEQDPLRAGRSQTETDAVQALINLDHNSFGSINSMKILPYMMSDTSPTWLSKMMEQLFNIGSPVAGRPWKAEDLE
ncbi:MAG TPA: hypothetical protein V6C69_18400, partial [Trichormus sp.]